MKNNYTMLKRTLLVVAVAIGTAASVSCLRDDDLEIFRHPIHIQGSVSPNYAIPLASGQMSFNDLISNLSSDFTGYLEEGSDVITIKWDGEYSDTIYPLNEFTPTTAPRPATKDDTYLYSKDTIITQSIPIPLFDNADLEDLANSSMALHEAWVTLTVAAKGEPAMVANHVSASFSDLVVTYVDRDGITRPFDELISRDEVVVENLTQGLHKRYDSVNIATIVNLYASQIDVSFRLKVNINSSVLYHNWEQYSFREMLDSIQMTRLIYSIGASLRVPFDLNVGQFSYTYDLDLGDQTSGFNLDSIINKIHDSLHVDVDSLKLMLDFYNHIPTDLTIGAWLLDENGATLTNLFDNRTIRSAKVHEMQPPYRGSHMAYDTTHSAIPLMLTGSDLDNLRRSRTLRLRAALYSHDNYVAIRHDDYLRIKASLQAAITAKFEFPVTENGLLKK